MKAREGEGAVEYGRILLGGGIGVSVGIVEAVELVRAGEGGFVGKGEVGNVLRKACEYASSGIREGPQSKVGGFGSCFDIVAGPPRDPVNVKGFGAEKGDAVDLLLAAR